MEKTELTPKQIVAELNKYIVGQSEAKKSVSIALRNRRSAAPGLQWNLSASTLSMSASEIN